jgi:hypothetical protein
MPTATRKRTLRTPAEERRSDALLERLQGDPPPELDQATLALLLRVLDDFAKQVKRMQAESDKLGEMLRLYREKSA